MSHISSWISNEFVYVVLLLNRERKIQYSNYILIEWDYYFVLFY